VTLRRALAAFVPFAVVTITVCAAPTGRKEKFNADIWWNPNRDK